MKILLFISIVFIIIAINLIISCPTKEGFMKNKKKEADEDKDVSDNVQPEKPSFIFEKKDYNDDGNPSQKFLKTFQRQKIEFDGEFSLKSLTPEIPDNEQEAKKMQKERDAKREEQKKAKKETQRESERQIKRRERDAKRFCISSIPKTLWQWITEPFREIYRWVVYKFRWIGKCVDAKIFIVKKIWDILKLIFYGFRDVMYDIIMFPCRKLGIDKAYRPLWRSKVNVYNSITNPIKELLTWKKLKILRALKFIC
ncbi:MAG: hypothetical protein CML42_09775 [Rhodobacteraceae bacterium]|nr:hypothetical protein [Paracoccaceae bacterium]|tara:strand:+ start:36322 stop:37086 length:765 start_codon:yes stop_codon:yes gene_type:complete